MALRPNNNYRGNRREEEPYRINQLIRGVEEVRLVGENIEQGVYPFSKAIELAEAQSLDLVEISPNAVPPVCKVIDYAKFKYDQKKKQKEIKANATKTVIKEIRFGPNTDEHDFNFKLKHAVNFLKEGAKDVKIRNKNISTHSMRKSGSRFIWENNGHSDEYLIKLSSILNHSSTYITRKYLGISREEIKDIYQSFDELM